MSRQAADLDVDGVDHLLCAINDARTMAQNLYTFRRLRTDAFIKTSMLGADYTTAVKATPSDGGTQVLIKLIEKVWEFQQRTISAGTLYERSAQIDYRSDRAPSMSLPLAGTSRTTYDYRQTTNCTGNTFAWIKGSKFFVNYEAATWVLVEVVQKLPDLEGDESSDFFIDNAPNWLLWQSIQCLNGYLKEDQRVSVSQRLLTDAWEAFTQWDIDTTASNDAGDLE